MISSGTPHGRHRLVEDARPPALLPRSATVIAATVGVVFTLGVPGESEPPTPRPQPDAPGPALQPVVLEPDERRSDPVPAALDGRAIAGAHAAGSGVARHHDGTVVPPTPAATTGTLFAA